MGRPVQNVNPAPSIAAGALKLRTVSPSARSLSAQCGALLYLQAPFLTGRAGSGTLSPWLFVRALQR